MPLKFRHNKNAPIAVDLGATRVRMLQLVAGPEPLIRAAAARAVPDSVREDPDGWAGFCIDAVQALSREGGFAGRSVVVALPARATFVQHLRLNGEGAVEGQLAQHLREALNVEPAQLIVRHVDVCQTMVNEATRREVICMAAARGQVMRYLSKFQHAKMGVAGMHAEHQAIHACGVGKSRRSGDEELATMSVDIGSASTRVVIAHGPDLVFAKQIAVGGEHFDRQFAEQLQIDLAEARDRRRRQASTRSTAAAATGAAPSASPPPLPAAEARRSGTALLDAPEVPETIDPEGEMLDALVDELRLCVSYHAALFEGRGIDRIVFYGGEARQTRLCRHITQSLAIEGKVGDPLGGLGRAADAHPPVGVELREPQPDWAVCVGLAALAAGGAA